MMFAGLRCLALVERFGNHHRPHCSRSVSNGCSCAVCAISLPSAESARQDGNQCRDHAENHIGNYKTRKTKQKNSKTPKP